MPPPRTPPDPYIVGLKMLLEATRERSDLKPMLFVLSDGRRRDGLVYKVIRPVVKGLSIPVYTIGYEADLQALRNMSGLVEAASIKATRGKVGYALGSIFNAQM